MLLGLLYGFLGGTFYGFLICAVKLVFKSAKISVFQVLYLRSFIAIFLVTIIMKIFKISPFSITRKLSPYLLIRCTCGYLGFVF
jgi:drug/metabolite transporter (DMT)-like permease